MVFSENKRLNPMRILIRYDSLNQTNLRNSINNKKRSFGM